MRRRLINDKEATIRSFDFNENDVHHLSRAERKQIADHLWMIPANLAAGGTYGDDDMGMRWGLETISIAKNSAGDYYESRVGDYKNDVTIVTRHRIYPSTSRFLRAWIASHPNITKHFHLE